MSPVICLLDIPLFWHKQTDHLYFSLSYETTLLLTVPLPFIPLTVRLSENHRQIQLETAMQQHQLHPLKTTQLNLPHSWRLNWQRPTVFIHYILGPLCILTIRKLFLNLLFLATYSAYYFYCTHWGHRRFFSHICQSSSRSSSSFKALILPFSFYSCWGLLQYFSQIFRVTYLQVRGRKFPCDHGNFPVIRM